jgi:hypothetical protein
MLKNSAFCRSPHDAKVPHVSLLKQTKIERAKTRARFVPAWCAPHNRGLNPFFPQEGRQLATVCRNIPRYDMAGAQRGADTVVPKMVFP